MTDKAMPQRAAGADQNGDANGAIDFDAVYVTTSAQDLQKLARDMDQAARRYRANALRAERLRDAFLAWSARMEAANE